MIADLLEFDKLLSTTETSDLGRRKGVICPILKFFRRQAPASGWRTQLSMMPSRHDAFADIRIQILIVVLYHPFPWK